MFDINFQLFAVCFDSLLLSYQIVFENVENKQSFMRGFTFNNGPY